MKTCVYPALLAAILLGGGCASPDVNPDRPAPRTGYVDFFVDPDEPLCWQVMRMDDPSGAAVKVFEQYEPATEPVLRLAFAPGRYDLRVSVLNHVIGQPGRVAVEVKDGSITPVRVTLTEAGKTQVEVRSTRMGGTYYGRYGRGTKLRLGESSALRVDTELLEPLPYQPKAKMPYAQVETNSPAVPEK